LWDLLPPVRRPSATSWHRIAGVHEGRSGARLGLSWCCLLRTGSVQHPSPPPGRDRDPFPKTTAGERNRQVGDGELGNRTTLYDFESITLPERTSQSLSTRSDQARGRFDSQCKCESNRLMSLSHEPFHLVDTNQAQSDFSRTRRIQDSSAANAAHRIADESPRGAFLSFRKTDVTSRDVWRPKPPR